jgi:hypothetical protein
MNLVVDIRTLTHGFRRSLPYSGAVVLAKYGDELQLIAHRFVHFEDCIDERKLVRAFSD